MSKLRNSQMTKVLTKTTEICSEIRSEIVYYYLGVLKTLKSANPVVNLGKDKSEEQQEEQDYDI